MPSFYQISFQDDSYYSYREDLQDENSVSSIPGYDKLSSLLNNPYYQNEKNWAEKIMIFTALFALILGFGLGLWRGDLSSKDEQKDIHIQAILQAIENYYSFSAQEPEAKRYPIATCSGVLNSYDYDITLKTALTGVDFNLNQPQWLELASYPQDLTGQYQGRYQGLKNPVACPELAEIDQQRYDLAGFEFCDQNLVNSKNCYLYTSSTNGDSFKLAYYNLSQGKYYIYSNFRDQGLKLVIE